MTNGRITRHRAARLLLAGCTLTALDTAAAWAQADNADIVVTAQRRSERLVDVPMSVSALPEEALQKNGVFDFDNLTRATTGVRISRTGVFAQPAIRGISTQTLGAGQENNVATYVDGFYQPDQLTLSGDLIGIDNVQILKGPQGTLYGRNATGGAILVNTVSPTDTFEGSAHLGYARYNDWRADAHVNIPLTQGLAFNIVGNYRKTDGYIRDVSGDFAGTGSPTFPPPYDRDRNVGFIKDWGIRAKLLAQLGPDVKLTLAYRHRFFADNRGTAFFMTDYPALGPEPGVGFNEKGYDYVGNSVPSENDVKLDEGSAKIEVDTGIGTLTSYTAYTEQLAVFNADYDGSKVDFVQAGGTFPRKTWQQAIDFNIDKIDRLNIIIGGQYFNDDASGSSDTVILGGLVSSIVNRLRTDAWAIFADGTYDLTDQLHLTIGGRYSRETKKFTSRFACCGLDGVELFPGVHKATFANFTPRGVLRYEIGPQTNVYASISRGFKSGTFNSVGSTPASVGIPAVKPETITAYEVGFKTSQPGFRLEAAGYYYDYKNLQLTRLFITSGGVDQGLENAATAEIYGIEVSGEWNPVEPLTLTGSVNYSHARYKKFPDGAASVPVGGFITSTSQDFSGRQIPRAPDWSANLGASYVVPVGEGDVTLDGSLYYSSGFVPTTPSYDPATGSTLFRQPSYAQVNAAVTWHSPGDRFEVGAYVNNITNTRYRIWYNATALGAWYVLSEPTVYGVRAGVKF